VSVIGVSEHFALARVPTLHGRQQPPALAGQDVR